MSNVIDLHSKKVDEYLVETLKRLLEKAEKGELDSLIYVDKYTDGECGYGWNGVPDQTMIGVIEEMKYAFFSRLYFPIDE